VQPRRNSLKELLIESHQNGLQGNITATTTEIRRRIYPFAYKIKNKTILNQTLLRRVLLLAAALAEATGVYTDEKLIEKYLTSKAHCILIGQ
jgi:hypothetical protein